MKKVCVDHAAQTFFVLTKLKNSAIDRELALMLQKLKLFLNIYLKSLTA